MIYLDVLPAILVYLALLGFVTVAVRSTSADMQFFPYLWRTLVASTAGIRVANLMYWSLNVSVGIFLLVIYRSNQVPPAVPQFLARLLQPMPASLLGCTVGGLISIAWAYLAMKSPGKPLANSRLAR